MISGISAGRRRAAGDTSVERVREPNERAQAHALPHAFDVLQRPEIELGSPALPAADALRCWLAGIASRQASHYRDKAHRRHELPAVDPDRLSAFAAPSPEARLVARGLLRAFHRLRPELREILSLAATGLSSLEIAASLSLPRPTVATRLRLARRLFARALTRARRWPRCAR
ncbi:RNA polymerase sigma factor [Sorangium sp. So ce341]|uniref:RNA polymerase sigma factor n=1 Tax=Sorangium sp. So ce341 TaxID=3133302 RepID=UPI003F63FD7A